ncbi:beta-ketoacyl synthase N-terminal-like domain-containing protein [Dactylosporangium cerinum]
MYCVILGGAVNNDGATAGLTLPGAATQAAVARAALTDAGVRPAAVRYVELHGTGTRAGDPVEAAALGEAYRADRPAGEPLLVGSAKTNVGHLEGAAGVVGLVKVALGLARGVVPASLNFTTPNPAIDFEGLRLAVAREPVPWPAGGLAGVSSFGMGGTNCHLVLGGPPPGPADRHPAPATATWVVSARSTAALREQAGRLHAALSADPALRIDDVALTLATGRDRFAVRATLHGTRAELLDGLAGLRDGAAPSTSDPGAGPVTGARRVRLPTYAFQRQRYWLGDDTPATAAPAGGDLRVLVRSVAADVLGHGDAAEVDLDRPFRDLGLDSLGGVELAERLAAATGLPLTDTLVYEHPTPAAVVAHLTTRTTGTAATGEDEPRPATAPAGDDPIAVVALGGRWPGGADSPEALWRLLQSGTDVIGGFPINRGWDVDRLHDPEPGRSGRTYVRQGGFLYDADRFDAGLFGIAPREAAAMDPQQRLLLEVAWETFERAGLDPARLRGSRTGVFVGLTSHDYGPRLHRAAPAAQGYALTGSTVSVASGRLAYALGLQGPAISVDTACSSSLVALHLAAASLRAGESDLVLTGGAAVMGAPGMFTEFSQQRGLAPDGRCKPFAAAADGTAWAEGVGLIVLERLSDARRLGHPVLAILRGTAVNSDGASNGLTAPSGPAQRRVIRQALAAAALAPSDVDVLEAHGTGTTLGDPIEAQAVLATYGQDRPADRPLWIGSVKSQLGHTQAAAGITGVIAMVLAMRHGVLPPTLHVDAPSPHVDWSSGSVRLLTAPTAWPVVDRPRRAGVSSFGISGTNAHAILEQAPPAAPAPAPVVRAFDGPVPLLVSAAGPAALAEQARRLHDALVADPGLDLLDVAWTLVTARANLDERAVVLATDRAEAVRGLAALAGGAQDGLIRGTATQGRLAVTFTGQGAQRAGMGRELYQRYPVYAAAFDAVIDALDEGPAVRRAVFDGTDLDRTDRTQSALFAVEVALLRLLESWGVSPDLVAGHSVGEITAAHAAGVLSLPDAARLVSARGGLMASLPSGGVMLSVAAGEAEVRAVLPPGAGIAAVNGPAAVVVSGDEPAVHKVAEHFEAQGRALRRLRVSHAFHSHHMDPILEQFRAVAGRLVPGTARAAVVSTVTGGPLTAPDASYWVRQVREPVRFADAVTAIAEAGVTDVLELGPDAVLTGLGRQVPLERAPRFVAGQRRGRPEPQTLLEAVARLHVHGVSVDWTALFEGVPARRVDLPTYAFQRQRYWLEDADDAAPTWWHRVAWRPLPETPRSAADGTWLIVVPDGAAPTPQAAALAGRCPATSSPPPRRPPPTAPRVCCRSSPSPTTGSPPTSRWSRHCPGWTLHCGSPPAAPCRPAPATLSRRRSRRRTGASAPSSPWSTGTAGAGSSTCPQRATRPTRWRRRCAGGTGRPSLRCGRVACSCAGWRRCRHGPHRRAPGSRPARSWSPAAPAGSAPTWPGGSPPAARRTCCWSAAAARRRPAPTRSRPS